MDQITFCTDYTESYNCIEASKLPPFYLYQDDRHKMKQRGEGRLDIFYTRNSVSILYDQDATILN